MPHKFLIHHTGDHVGVAVTEIKQGEAVEGVFMDTDKRVTVTSNGDIPLWHKIALVDLKPGDAVIKYSVQVAVVTQPIKVGDYVHTQNIRTARW